MEWTQHPSTACRRDTIVVFGVTSSALVIGCSVASGHVLWSVWWTVALSGMCLGLFLARPHYALLAVVVTIPLEVSKLLFPFWRFEKAVDGQPLSILDLSRIALILIVFVGVARSLRRWSFGVPVGSVALTSCVFYLYVLYSGVFQTPDLSKGLSEIARLSAHLALMWGAIAWLDSTAKVRQVVHMFLITMNALAVFGIYQLLTGFYIWNASLVERYGHDRINATFLDPNYFARYLAIAALMSCLMVWQSRRRVKPFMIASLCICAIALIVTFSRSGWLVLAAGMGMVGLVTRGPDRQRALALGVTLASLMVVAYLAFEPVTTRVNSFLSGGGALGTRIALIATGLEMYRDHPILGAGLGAFQLVALEQYKALLPYEGSSVTLSHTSLVTIMAELGTVGLVLTVMIYAAVYLTFRRARLVPSAPARQNALIAFLGILCVTLSAQAESRMFEDPFLWLFIGMLVAVDRIPHEDMPAGQCD
jgi:O-antigen ligase